MELAAKDVWTWTKQLYVSLSFCATRPRFCMDAGYLPSELAARGVSTLTKQIHYFSKLLCH